MYFRNFLCTFAFATLASAAVAKQIPTPYPSETYDDGSEDLLERDAEADPVRKAAWEEAHGGEAPSYHFGEDHNPGAWHVAREAEPMAEAEPGWAHGPKHGVKHTGAHTKPANWASWFSSGVKNAVKPTAKPWSEQIKQHLKGQHGHGKKPGKHARDVEDGEEFDDDEFADLEARDVGEENVPDFGDDGVDTSLEGYGEPLEARDVDDEDADYEDDDDSEGLERREAQPEADAGAEGDADYSLDGYDFDESEEDLEKRDVDEEETEEGADDEDFEDLEARDVADDEVPDFGGDDDVDTSLEGYGEPLEARSLDDDEVPDFGDDEVDTTLEGYGDPLETRDVDDEDDDDEDIDDTASSADAAYENEPVVEELIAEPELEARDAHGGFPHHGGYRPSHTGGRKPASSSRGVFRIPW